MGDDPVSALLMPDPTIGRESYMHRAAKEVVARWLRASIEVEGKGERVHMGTIVAQPNRGAPFYGVHIEYPITADGVGVSPVWDEAGWPGCGSFEDYDGTCPTAETLIAAGLRVACVCDIALWHKGWCTDIIEVVHKHPTPKWKIDFLRRVGVQDIWEVKAEWVMRQTARPTHLDLEQRTYG